MTTYLFNWDEVPGNDSERLKEFLKQEFDIGWVKTAKIKKIRDGKTIEISTEKNYLSLERNNEKTKVILAIDDCRITKFIIMKEKGKLNIYKIANLEDNLEKLKEAHYKLIKEYIKILDKASNLPFFEIKPFSLVNHAFVRVFVESHIKGKLNELRVSYIQLSQTIEEPSVNNYKKWLKQTEEELTKFSDILSPWGNMRNLKNKDS
jgi:hypothetical protein